MASAAILNGGQSRRYGGRNKAALTVSGQTILSRQLAMLATITNDIMIAGVVAEAPGTPVRLIADRLPGHGPLAGLEAALAAARDDLTILLAGDMPCVTAALLARLLDLTDGVDVVVPRTESGYHPLCAVYRRSCLPVVTQHLAANRLAMKDLFAAVRVREVTERELAVVGTVDRLLANVNTPAEHDELEALLTHEL